LIHRLSGELNRTEADQQLCEKDGIFSLDSSEKEKTRNNLPVQVGLNFAEKTVHE